MADCATSKPIFRSTPVAATSDERTSCVLQACGGRPMQPMYTNEQEEACHSYDERLGILLLSEWALT
jgi:hypothetical protein